MEQPVKHRVIGIFVILSVLVIIAPLLTKSTKPAWLSKQGDKRFDVPLAPETSVSMAIKPIIKKELQALKHIEITIPSSRAEVALATASAQLAKEISKVAVLENVVKKKGIKGSDVSKQNHDRLEENGHYEISETGKSNPGHLSRSKADKVYTLQIATFIKTAHAQRLMQKLQQLGYTPYQRKYSTTTGKNFIAIMLGQTSTKTDLRVLQQKMDNFLNIKSIIVTVD